jgi:hypothetical protein
MKLAMATKSIEVSVSRRILHIGSAAYPLANIARVQSQRVKFKRWPAIRAFIVQVVIWIALGAIATFAIKYAYNHNSGGITYDKQQRYLGIVRLASGILIGLSLLWLLYRLVPTWRRYYALVIETAGTAAAALINPDRSVITDLVARITRAIDDPDNPINHFHITTNNHTNNNNYGGNNVQFGAGSKMSV